MLITARVILLRFSAARSAVTAIEYALMASLVAVVIVAGVISLQGGLSNSFTAIANAVASPGGGTSSAPAQNYPNLGPSKPCTNGDSGNCVTNSSGDQLQTPPGYPY